MWHGKLLVSYLSYCKTSCWTLSNIIKKKDKSVETNFIDQKNICDDDDDDVHDLTYLDVGDFFGHPKDAKWLFWRYKIIIWQIPDECLKFYYFHIFDVIYLMSYVIFGLYQCLFLFSLLFLRKEEMDAKYLD